MIGTYRNSRHCNAVGFKSSDRRIQGSQSITASVPLPRLGMFGTYRSTESPTKIVLDIDEKGCFACLRVW